MMTYLSCKLLVAANRLEKQTHSSEQLTDQCNAPATNLTGTLEFMVNFSRTIYDTTNSANLKLSY